MIFLILGIREGLSPLKEKLNRSSLTYFAVLCKYRQLNPRIQNIYQFTKKSN